MEREGGKVVGQTLISLDQLLGLALQQAAGLLVFIEHFHLVQLRVDLRPQQTPPPVRRHPSHLVIRLGDLGCDTDGDLLADTNQDPFLLHLGELGRVVDMNLPALVETRLCRSDPLLILPAGTS